MCPRIYNLHISVHGYSREGKKKKKSVVTAFPLELARVISRDSIFPQELQSRTITRRNTSPPPPPNGLRVRLQPPFLNTKEFAMSIE